MNHVNSTKDLIIIPDEIEFGVEYRGPYYGPPMGLLQVQRIAIRPFDRYAPSILASYTVTSVHNLSSLEWKGVVHRQVRWISVDL
jgi:hypothetical protein